MAKYKTLPNYELLRPELHVQFDSEGFHETDNEADIEFLDGLAPFIERVDEPKPKPAAKPKPKPKATETK